MADALSCDECGGSGYELLLNRLARCGACMGDPDDTDKTPAHTPNAKKSSGQWTLNLDSALCPRKGCGHRRDEHAMNGRVAEDCLLCDCRHFVVGGPDYDSLPDTLAEDDT